LLDFFSDESVLGLGLDSLALESELLEDLDSGESDDFADPSEEEDDELSPSELLLELPDDEPLLA
jgi:hypothetical protein